MGAVSLICFVSCFGRLGHFQFITGDRVWVNKANRHFGAASASVVVWVLFHRFSFRVFRSVVFSSWVPIVLFMLIFWLLPCHALSASFLIGLVARLKLWFDSQIV